MEPTRVGSFDEIIYQIWADFCKETFDDCMEWVYGRQEQRIADSHDITKSNFGLEEWQK